MTLPYAGKQPKKGHRKRESQRIEQDLTAREKAALEDIERWYKARAELEAIGKVKDTSAASAAYFCEKRNIQKDPLKG